MNSSNRPPAKTPNSFGPKFLSDRSVKMTFSKTNAAIKYSDDSSDCDVGCCKCLPNSLSSTSEGSAFRGFKFPGNAQ